MTSLRQCVHRLPPTRTKHSHDVEAETARKPYQAQDREEPTVADGIDNRSSNQGSDTREDVAHKVVQRNPRRCFLRHEFRQHCRRHAEDQHGSYAEKEVGNHLHHILEEGPFRNRLNLPQHTGTSQ